MGFTRAVGAASSDGERLEVPCAPDHVHAAHTVIALTDAATIDVPSEDGDDFRVTLGGDRTLGEPDSAVDGQRMFVQVTQDSTGSRTLAYASGYDWGTTGAPTLTTTAGKTDLLEFVYNAALEKWLGLRCIKGF